MQNKKTLTGLKDYLNNKYGRKSTRKEFTTSDVQGYISRGFLPEEYGGQQIVLDEVTYRQSKVKLYSLEK